MTISSLTPGWHPSARGQLLHRARLRAFERLQDALVELGQAQGAYDALDAECREHRAGQNAGLETKEGGE